MKLLIYVLIIAVFFCDYLLVEYPELPRLIAWAPDGVAAVMMLMIVLRVGYDRDIRLPAKYIVWGSLMLALVFIGVVVNEVQPGAIFYGLRKYGRYIPVFLAPIVFPPSERELKHLLIFILALAVCQLPFAAYQRVVDLPLGGGDVVYGTTMNSGTLSYFLLSSLAVVTAFYVKGHIGLGRFLMLALVLAFPTWLNETTAALVLLPLALAAPFLLWAVDGGGAFRRLVPATVVLALLLAGFVKTYDAQFGQRWGGGVANVLSAEGAGYLYHGETRPDKSPGDKGEVGRLDSIVLPLQVFRDPVQWLVGAGAGNASDSYARIFRGDYVKIADRLGAKFTTLAVLMWELGILGVLLSLMLFWMIFQDARVVARSTDLAGAFGLGWASALVVTGATLFYKDLVNDNVSGFLMWLLCGCTVALRRKSPATHATIAREAAGRDELAARKSVPAKS